MVRGPKAKWRRILRQEGEEVVVSRRAVGSADSTTGVPAITRTEEFTILAYFSPSLARRIETSAGPATEETKTLYTQDDIYMGDRFPYDGGTWEVDRTPFNIRRKGDTVITSVSVVRLEAS